MTAKEKGIPLLVTTQHRGVFFGYGQKTKENTIEIKQARMAVYWTSDLKGVFGLAVGGTRYWMQNRSCGVFINTARCYICH